MKILIIDPNRNPYLAEIENTLAAKQGVVGSLIDIFDLQGNAVAVLNDEGKNMGFPICRTINDVEIAGRFFICNRAVNGELNDITQ